MRAHCLLLPLILSHCAWVQADADIPRPEHPTPIAVRPHWHNLNGSWEFRFDEQDEGIAQEWFAPTATGFDRRINVPFPWESALSGIQHVDPKRTIGWYRRTLRIPESFPSDQRVVLHFGAVDLRTDVWLNGQKVGEHEGGYTPFQFDITPLVHRDADNTLVVRAFDPTDPSLPTGKQVGWYTPSSGIWQTVWLEARPASTIESFRFSTMSLNPVVLQVNLVIKPAEAGEYSLQFSSPDESIGTRTVSFATSEANAPEIIHTFMIPVADPKLWSPESPHLYDATLELRGPSGAVDTIETYFGLRTIARGRFGDSPHESVLLNGKPVYLRLALDQSFNPEGLYTAPSDEFLKNDIELARAMGLNGLRIHIKSEEPRKLYWADKLGLLIMQDMPNTWRQNARARAAWEATARATVARDLNHPCIFAWVAFNETWGLGTPEQYKASKDTQQWVKDMVALIRAIDPTRLIEDNSPCNYDHVGDVTDFNSWHFYIDDHAEARRHIEQVVEQSVPGSSFNHCPGEVMNSAPLINSEYGSVSAGGGDRDISWGFRDLTTQLRKYPKIQGYVYTELTDIEWEHNGFANYDRTPKSFGYDSFIPDMTPADLQGADFVGYDAPPVIHAKVGEVIRVPVFVSHFSDRAEPPTLRWWVTGLNDDGTVDTMEAKTRPVTWKPYDVTRQNPVAFKIGGPLVGAVCFELLDTGGARIAANFVNLVVSPEAAAPRVERIDDHHVALRFRPEDYAASRWSGGQLDTEGKAAATGSGHLLYHLQIPETIINARPTDFTLKMEAAARAGRAKVDWPERVNAQDYPQTDTRKHPTSVLISVNGEELAAVALPDDPADARGVLSHVQARDHGSYGFLIEAEHPLPDSASAALAENKPLVLKFEVPQPGEPAGGLAIFSADTGAYPFDPTLILTTELPLPPKLGIENTAPITVNTVASRRVLALATGEPGATPATWAFTSSAPPDGWHLPEFDDAAWTRAPGGFGTRGTPGVAVNTRWNTPDIWLRTHVDLDAFDPTSSIVVRLYHDEDCEVFVNGKPLLERKGYITAYESISLAPEQVALFQPGRNTIAVHCHQTGGGQGIDLGLLIERNESP